MEEQVSRGNPPKNGTSHLTLIRRILFCIFSGQHRNFCSLRRSVATGNYQILEEVLGGNPPKNGTSHWTSLLGMFFCTFCGQFRNFRSFCTSLVTGNYDMLEVVSCGTPLKMVFPTGCAYEKSCSVYFPGSMGIFVLCVGASQQEIMRCWKRFWAEILRKMALPIGRAY